MSVGYRINATGPPRGKTILMAHQGGDGFYDNNEIKYDIQHLHQEDFGKQTQEEETLALAYHAFPQPGKYSI